MRFTQEGKSSLSGRHSTGGALLPSLPSFSPSIHLGRSTTGMRQRLDGVRGAEPVDALTSMARWYKPGSSTDDVTTNLLIVLIAPALAVVHALLLLKVLMALRRLLRSLRVEDAAPKAKPPAASVLVPAAAVQIKQQAPAAQVQKGTAAALRAVTAEAVAHAHHAWAPIAWESIKLRVGPDYKRKKKKAPTAAPLLPCVGVELLRAEQKVYSDGHVDAACLPPEVAAAAAEPTPPHRPSAATPPPLPRFLVVNVHVPSYGGPEPDGPNLRIAFVLAVPPDLRSEPTSAARLLCDFLDGSASGHTDPAGAFYDRFKVIVRSVNVDVPYSFFLRKMVEWFNGKPMLWRFFGVWGSCKRRGAATFVDLDFCTGGRLKNSAFAEGIQHGSNLTFDISWTLEARSDEEMPECLIGGATICRGQYMSDSVPRMYRTSTGVYALSTSAGLAEPAESSGAAAASGKAPAVVEEKTPVKAALSAPGGTTSPSPATISAISAAVATPIRAEVVPQVLAAFIEARAIGDLRAASACCTDDVECVGPLGSTRGLRAARERFFHRPSHAGARVVVELAPEPRRPTDEIGEHGESARWKRVVEIEMAPFGAFVQLEQRFVVSYASAHGPRVARVEVTRK